MPRPLKGEAAARHALQLLEDVAERSARDNYVDTGDALEAMDAARRALHTVLESLAGRTP